MSRILSKLEAGYVRVANSWLSAVAIIFIVFAAAALLLDDYPIYVDGLFSLATAGYADAYPDLALVLERMMVKSQQHVPGYFLLLFVWGNLLDWTPLAMRLLTLFFGIISLALMYRLGRSLVSKEAGLLALVMLAGLAFYNIWLLPIRMYTLFVAAELLLLWMYFRAIRKQSAGAAQLIPVFLACVAFLYTHIFSLAALLGIGLYHLLFVPKNRSWFAIAGAFLLAGAVFLPWMDILIQGADFATDRAAEAITTLSAVQLLRNLLYLGVNGSVAFLMLFILAAYTAWKGDRVAIALWTITLTALAFYVAVNAVTGVIDLPRSRYAVILFPLMILLMVKGLMSLARWKLLILGIVLFWLASGLLYQRRVGAAQFVRSYDTIPIHLIERRLSAELRAGDLITGWSSGLSFDFESWIYGGIADYYFSDYRVDVDIEHTYFLENMDDREIAEIVEAQLAGRERVWLVYETARWPRYLPLWQAALMSRYQRCRIDDAVGSVRIELYQTPNCA